MRYRLAILGLVFSGIVNAQDNIETDRPDQTETAVLTKKGYFQGEFGLNYEKPQDRDYSLLLPTVLLKYGISKRFEFRLTVNYRKDYFHMIPKGVEIKGFEPVELGTKIALFEEKNARPKTSLIAHIGLSEIASDAYKPAEPVGKIVFTMQHTLTKITSIGYNLGLSWDGESSSPVFAYTFAPGFNLTDRFYFFVESFGFIGKQDFHDHNIDAGIAYLLNKDMKIDFAGGKGLSEASCDYFFSVGFSFRLPLKNSSK